MSKWKFLNIIGDIWKHGFNSRYLKQITESDPVSNWLKGTTGSGLTTSQIEQNDWNAEQAQVQRDWTERMDNTKYQRQVTDMQSAGLNPAMMYGQGVSASTPSGAASSGGDAGFSSGGLLSSVMDIIFAKQRMRNLRAEEENIKSQSNKNDADADLSRSRRTLADRDVSLRDLAIEYYPRLNEQQIRKVESEIEKAYSDIDVNQSRILDIDADRALKDAQTFVESLKGEWYPRLSYAKEESDKAAAAYAYAQAAMQKYMKQFAEEHGGQMPGYNMWSGLAASLSDALKDMGWSDVELDKLDWSDIAWPALSFFYRSFGKKKGEKQ